MKHTGRDPHVRDRRRSRSAAISKPLSDAHTGHPRIPIPDPKSADPNPNYEDAGWGYYNEEQLEEILLTKLEILYNEAVCKLAALGYEAEVALKAVLKRGYCYGGMDVLTNILHNSLAYLSSNRGSGSGNGSGSGSEESGDDGPVFGDLRQMVEYSLDCVVHMLRQFRPQLSRGDAMWCLLMSNLHIGRASAMEIPPMLSTGGKGDEGGSGGNASLESVGAGNVGGMPPGVIAPMLCRFHSGWGFGEDGEAELSVNNGFFPYSMETNSQGDIECPRSFGLSPTMKSMLRRNVAAFAAGYRAQRKFLNHLHCWESMPSNGDGQLVSSRSEVSTAERCAESQSIQKPSDINSMLSKFDDLNLNEKTEPVTEEQKDEMIATLTNQVKELEKQVKERKEWAHQKAMQAARKLSHDLTELKVLRMEREENLKWKKGKQSLDETTMKRLSEMENALRKASGQVDRANAAVRRLENENAEIRAEMEASKLSASESAKTSLEAAKREKKCLKRILALEKQKAKLQEEIAERKQKGLELQQHLARIKQSRNDYEDKRRQELNAKDLASAQVDEERHLKETAEATSKRRIEALQLKVEIDLQCHKDDVQRLEEEYSRLKASVETTTPLSHALTRGDSEGPKSHNGALASLLHEFGKMNDSLDNGDADRQCILCMRDEASIVFLPCAHQVLCASCGDNSGKKGRAICPCCRVPIEQRIRVFGANS